MTESELTEHRPYVRRVALRNLGGDKSAADAVTQRVMECAWKKTLRRKASARAWLRTVTRAICVDYVRESILSEMTQSVGEMRTAKDAHGWTEAPEEAIYRNELADAIKRAAALLPPKQRKVFEMRARGYRHQAIADELRIRQQTVKNYLGLAYSAMRDNLTAWGFSPCVRLPGKSIGTISPLQTT